MENISVPPMIPLSKLRDKKEVKNNSEPNLAESRPIANRPEAAKTESISEQKPAGAPAVIPGPLEHEYKLMGVEGVYAGAVFPLDEDIILGRDAKEVNIVYPADALRVSRKHCQVWVSKEGQVFIRDLGSSNGTFFADGDKLQSNAAYRLNPDECFYLGSVQETYRLILGEKNGK